MNQIVPFGSPTSMLQLMIMVGGTDAKTILVIRNESGKENRYTINYQKIVKGTEPDFMLKSGDMVIIESETTAWSGIIVRDTPVMDNSVNAQSVGRTSIRDKFVRDRPVGDKSVSDT